MAQEQAQGKEEGQEEKETNHQKMLYSLIVTKW